MVDVLNELYFGLERYYIVETGYALSREQVSITCFYNRNHSLFVRIDIRSVDDLSGLGQYLYDHIISRSPTFLPERSLVSRQMELDLEALPKGYSQKVLPMALQQWKGRRKPCIGFPIL